MSFFRSQKAKGVAWLFLVAGLATISVLGFAVAVRQIPRPFEDWLGHKMLSFPRASVCDDPEGRALLQRLVKRIFPLGPLGAPGSGSLGSPLPENEKEIPLSVTVLRGQTVNAFTALGSEIYVYDGVLGQAEDPEELAGVLAHEIGHVMERHVLQSLAFRAFSIPLASAFLGPDTQINARALNALAQLKFSREEEHEADLDGYKRLQDADVDTSGLGRFFDRLKDSGSVPELLRDHPASVERAKLAAYYQVKNPRPVLSGEEWQKLRTMCRQD